MTARAEWRTRLRAELDHQDRRDALDDIDAVAGELEFFGDTGETDTAISRKDCHRLASELRAAAQLLQDAIS